MGGFAGGDEGGYWDDIPSSKMNKQNNIKKDKPYIYIHVIQDIALTLR